MAIRAVLFDFDGILVDTEWAIYQAWLRTFQAHDHDLPLELYTRCIGSDFDTWSPKTHLEELTGNAFDWHDLDAKRQIEIRRDLEDQREMEGTQDCLKTLAAQCIPAAVVSSSSHDWVDGWLDRLDLRIHFQTIVCRGDAERIKPAPDLYLEAARRLALKPEQCLVIEDSLNGVRSAKAAGMKVWAVPNRVTACLDFEPADQVFRSLSACAEELQDLSGR
ncbi:MAG: HAD family phosphatase [Akkermansiaceae bacterium]|nr:HAD family phosphatase [Akkermansiaceae bacterium]